MVCSLLRCQLLILATTHYTVDFQSAKRKCGIIGGWERWDGVYGVTTLSLHPAQQIKVKGLMMMTIDKTRVVNSCEVSLTAGERIPPCPLSLARKRDYTNANNMFTFESVFPAFLLVPNTVNFLDIIGFLGNLIFPKHEREKERERERTCVCVQGGGLYRQETAF